MARYKPQREPKPAVKNTVVMRVKPGHVIYEDPYGKLYGDRKDEFETTEERSTALLGSCDIVRVLKKEEDLKTAEVKVDLEETLNRLEKDDNVR